ncbi:MAG: DNA translocase FtsK 4TM domain-containing protein [Peptoniphilaceae bacterium]|nr:DNA translocase FtsK 4TM domain-containing protein [Peptoniphilaceae bacterium]MDY6019059.1 DNA translocase FtsK 4TM domain-containing protein [Anaerococcus sp.]
MANTGRKRKSKSSFTKSFTKNKTNKKFNKKSLDLLIMALSLLSLVFLIFSNTGSLGKIITTSFTRAFGLLAFIIPIVIFVSFLFSYLDKYIKNLKSFVLLYLIVLITMAILAAPYLRNNLDLSLKAIETTSFTSGGRLGLIIGFYLIGLIGSVGMWVLYIALWIGFLIGLSPISYKEFFILLKNILLKLFTSLGLFIKSIKEKKEKSRKKKRIIEKKEDKGKEEKSIYERYDAISDDKQTLEENRLNDAEIKDYKTKQVEFSDFDQSFKKEFSNYNYPSIDLLQDTEKNHKIDNKDIKNKARMIEETLKSFGIGGRVVQINVGPTVTCYELKPDRGVKVSRILNLSDDLSLALATSEIRIEAPIPGKSHVGIEVSNSNKEIVGFKDMISSDEFVNSKYQIPFAIGKSISGTPVVTGIEKMPHLLVSGATGSGKSVCINTIIMSVLYKHAPDEVKLLMIDPKVVELSIYNGIPHLIMPVITDPKKASSSLYWAIKEMERRYKLFEETHVRDISSYRQMQVMDDTIEKLPYIIIIIDELSDLMMTAAGEVEDYITRLAQKSRACGIHLIIATQRPTVDVITGTIKANIPSRIAFAVSSQIDSRTILDMAGAEKLLGKGDMLFAPSDAMKPTRIQGAFVSDGEVLRVVESIKEVHKSEYNEDAIEIVEEKNQPVENLDEDELLPEAIEIIVNEQTASVSLLQRKLKIGYARAGRIIDQLEQRGLVGGYEGSKPRKVLVDRTYLEGE